MRSKSTQDRGKITKSSFDGTPIAPELSSLVARRPWHFERTHQREPMQTLETAAPTSIKNILYPTDFSSAAEAALPFVIDVARMFRSRVSAVHIRTPDAVALMPPLSFPYRTESPADSIQEFTHSLEHKLAAVEHQCLVGEGEVWDFLAQVIEEHEIDLVVVGTQGRTGLEKFMLGSVAELIFRQANCPVLTIGPNVANGAHRQWEMKNILWATDFTPGSLASAPLAFSLARQRQARLTLLSVLERPAPEDLVDPLRYIDSTVRMLQHQVPKGMNEDCQLSYEVSEGIPSDEILKAAKQHGCDLIVMGVRPASGRLGLATHLARPTAHKVVCQAVSPVLTVRG
jgi:nucleotide-binding universal stress UspA family protein